MVIATYVGPFDGCEDVALVRDDVAHHDVVENGADDATEHLGGEGTSGG